MALVEGTNCGFVTVAPVDDPAGTTMGTDTRAMSCNFIAPVGSVAITEIGWWCDNATEAADFQVGIYDDDAANNAPENLLASSGDIAKGTDAGWKKATVNYAITPGVTYWLVFQLDDTATTTNNNYSATGGMTYLSNVTELPAVWSHSTDSKLDRLPGVYAVYTTGVAGTTWLMDDDMIWGA